MKLTKVHLIWLLTAGFLFALTVLFHISVVSWQNESSWNLKLGYEIAVLGSFGALFGFANSYFESYKQKPLRALWTLFLIVVGVLIMNTLTCIRWEKGAFVFYHWIQKDTLSGAMMMCGMALLEGCMGIAILIQLRELVLFRRTTRSIQSWHIFLGYIAVSCFLSLLDNAFQIARPDNALYWTPIAFLIIGFLLMIWNCFRTSWIAYLSFKDKLLALGMCIGILFTLVFFALEIGASTNSEPIVLAYSRNLRAFLSLSVNFCILYALMACLSLIFHLPTTNEFKKKSDDLANLHALSKFIGEVFERDKLHQTIVTSGLEDEKNQMAWLALIDFRSGTLRPQIVATHRISHEQLAETIDVDALYHELKNEPLNITQGFSDHRIQSKALEYAVGSIVILPLDARKERLGALFITKPITDGFEEDDIQTLRTIADQAALAIDNARLFEERLEKERLQREFAIAREVQQKLLPHFLPKIEGATIAASNEFAHEVGGDYYDIVSLPNHAHNIIVADVSGKGTSAAFYMAELKGIYHSLSRTTQSPAHLLALANEALFARKEKNIFISAISAVIDTERETLALARAGHCPAITINLHGEVKLIRNGGLGLGLAKGERFSKTVQDDFFSLQPGDVYVFYTDGLIDSRNPDGEAYGYERLIASLKTHRPEDAQTIHDGLIADLKAFTQDLGYYDDLTLVVFKWHGINAPI